MNLDPTIEVNSLVLDHAIKLASETAHWLEEHASQETDTPVPASYGARAAVDLLIWRTPASLLAADGDDADGEEDAVDLGQAMAAEIARRWCAPTFDHAKFVPCTADWTGDPLIRPEFGPISWANPATARRLIGDGKSFSLEVIARYGWSVGVAPVWAGLGQRRIEQLAEFLRLHASRQFKDSITVEERAQIAESLAKAIAKPRKPDWNRWSAFYRDLPDFMGGQASALAGREILICQDGSLRATRSKVQSESTGATTRRRRRRPLETSVFIPPRRGDAEEGIGEELYPPAPLREFFAFLHDGMPWYGDLAAARQFLEQDLALPFESETLLTRISQIVERDATKKVRVAGLRWAFAIWRRSVAIKRPVALSAGYRLFVPTMDGEFIRASEAVFSSSWPNRTLGYQLQQFLELAPAGLKDIDDVRKRRLASPSNSTFGTRYIEEWTDFLAGLGVQRGLHPRSIALRNYVPAWRVSSFDFLEELGLPDAFGSLIKKDIESRNGISLSLPSSTNYDVGALWWMPGQADLDELSDDALDAYARLIVEWIGRVERRQLWTEIKHQHNYISDRRDWPTPLAAFLRSAAWVPCEQPSNEGHKRGRYLGREVWLSTSVDRYPPFLRRPSYKLARTLDRASDGGMEQLRARAGFRTFNASESLLEQVAFLADQFGQGCVRRFHERELMNIYSRCWGRMAEEHGATDTPLPAGTAPAQLLVRRGAQLGLARVAGSDAETVYVRDNTDSIATSLVEVIGDPLLDIRSAEPGRIGSLLHRLYGNQIRRTSELAYAINVDGAPLEDLSRGSRLVDQCPWLRPILAVSLEALDSVDLNRLPSDRSAIIQVLDRIELHLKRDVRFLLEGRDVTPPSARAAYHFRRSDGEPLVIIAGEGRLTWSQVEAALPAIGDAIQHSAVVPHMKLLTRQLSLEGVPVDDKPRGQEDLLRLCRALELGEQAIEAAKDALGEHLDRQLPWLRAIVFYLGGETAFALWSARELDATEDRPALIELLRSSLPGDAISPDEIVEAAKTSFSTSELRERLALDFSRFNESLIATGSQPDIDPEGQQSQLAFYIDDHRIAILDALRNMVAPIILCFEPEPRYKSSRDALSDLRPNPAWLERYERIPEHLLAEHIATWLKELGAAPGNENPHALADLASVRSANAATLRKVARSAQPLVRAWSIQRSIKVHDLWGEPARAEAELRRLLDDAGAFDCRPWDEVELIIWFARLGAWPAEMARTLDRDELGVPKTEIEAEAEKAREERENKKREARSVRLNGELRDPNDVDWLKLSEEISENLSRKLLNRPIGTFADLAPAELARRKRRGPGSGGGGGPYAGIPQEKKDMIGRLGELTIYHWLKTRQPGQDIDRCWVSGNAGPITGREGNDSLGYDFCISFNKQTWYIEVKASTEDPCQFEMGETEVRRARDVARSRSAERYVIAYVANVGQTGATTIDILPNPLGPDADGVLNIAGNSIRYTFGRRD